MKFRCSIWILWTTLACTTAPDVRLTANPPALSFVLSPTGIYELEDTSALIWRNNDPTLTNQAFYFSHMIFACPELSVGSRAIEHKSTTKNLTFISGITEPPKILNFKTNLPFCPKQKRYYPAVVPIIRQEDGYHINPELKGNRNRQEFSIGYEVVDDCNKLNEKRRLPSMERFEGLAEGSGWLEAFKVVYDIENLIARQVSYELNFFGPSETTPGNCEKIEVGKELEFFKEIRFPNAYRKSVQTGRRGTMHEVMTPECPKSQSVKRANVPTSSSSNPESESKRPRLTAQPEQSPTAEDESFNIDEVELIHLDAAPWDFDEHTCLRSLTDSDNPTTSTSNSKPQVESSKSTKRSQPSTAAFKESSDEEYMVMQQLAPIEYFDVFSIQWSTCTYLNVVPMWRSLASGPWTRVDQAIRKMLDVIGKLSIIAGTHGVLQLPKKHSDNQYQDVFLQSVHRNIAIPMLFYKFVVHKVPLPGFRGASWSFGIIIVMHNEFGVPTKRICPTDSANLCSEYGWDVGSKDDEIARPYCCKPTAATLAALDITSYSSNFLYLDLNSVVLEITGDGQNVVRNYNQLENKRYPVVAKKKGKTKKLNDIYF